MHQEQSLTPDRETVRQKADESKEPNEPMFTITAQDRHGVWHRGRIRRLMPIEVLAFTKDLRTSSSQGWAVGLKDSHLYKMAGNAVSVPVITAIGRQLKELVEQYEIIRSD